MDPSTIFISSAREALLVAVTISAPALLAALLLGLTISVFQALTQVQEQGLGEKEIPPSSHAARLAEPIGSSNRLFFQSFHQHLRM